MIKKIKKSLFPIGLSENMNCISASSGTKDMGACNYHDRRVLIIGKRMSCQLGFHRQISAILADLGIKRGYHDLWADQNFLLKKCLANQKSKKSLKGLEIGLEMTKNRNKKDLEKLSKPLILLW
ncbi:MAG: hypothetical protein V1714_05185 [Pseudomonadota bacterium]